MAEWLSHSAVEQEVPGSNPGAVVGVGHWAVMKIICIYLPL